MSIWSSIRDLGGYLRLRWTSYELGDGNYNSLNKFTSDILAKESREPMISPSGFIPGGWYMIEVEVRADLTKIDGSIFICQARQNSPSILKFPVRAGRRCKRLVFVPHRARMFVSLPDGARSCAVTYFQLSRVTSRFARDRMLKKLIALHPDYKISIRGNAEGRLLFQESRTIPMLWQDYCDVFESGGETFSYARWLERFDVPTVAYRERVQNLIPRFEIAPLISIVMPVYEPNLEWLAAAIESVKRQGYGNWELCIADDASKDPHVREWLLTYAKEDPRIKIVFRSENGHISAASNSALEIASGDWIALLDQDDLLAEEALFWVVEAINKNRDVRLIYSDEDKIDENGQRFEPYFKSNWNSDLFLSQNMFSHLGVYWASLIREIGGFRLGVEGSQDYDLVLRCIEKIDDRQIYHIPRVLYHWRVHSKSTAYSAEVKPYAVLAGQRALNDHFVRTRKMAVATVDKYGYRVRYSLPDDIPLVSIIIPSRNARKLLSACIGSIIQKTAYDNYEIIVVDNGSDESETVKFLRSLEKNPRIRIHRDSRPFNYSQLNNEAVKIARGSIICLLNDDVEVITSDWLGEMVSHALRPEVGAVGAKLLYPDDTVQHGGIVLGTDGVAGHAHRFEKRESGGYCGRAALIQCFSAVTGACLVVRKSVYESVGGLNERELAVSGNDVDFCLRAHKAGYRNIWTPYAELYHYESASRGSDESVTNRPRAQKEVAYMKDTWADMIENDPFYNPNLTLDDEGFGLAWPPRVNQLSA
ncbi:glycosyltransferase family 2 protein [Burkholderia cepacia]|uniref:glycosyltransferase family 2 protein n=1 Tax=Burkholderia cepacia TaxID=292 RepID=UPI000A8C8BD4|nr:glycosyltransferase family 2 protein [Burkholderia cepacia]